MYIYIYIYIYNVLVSCLLNRAVIVILWKLGFWT